MDNGATSRLSMANSPARKRKKSAVVQDSYHHIASTFFSLGKGNTTDLAFLEAARVSELKLSLHGKGKNGNHKVNPVPKRYLTNMRINYSPNQIFQNYTVKYDLGPSRGIFQRISSTLCVAVSSNILIYWSFNSINMYTQINLPDTS